MRFAGQEFILLDSGSDDHVCTKGLGLARFLCVEALIALDSRMCKSVRRS